MTYEFQFEHRQWVRLEIICACFVTAFSGCVAGERTVSVAPEPFVGPPAPLEIDQDSLAGQIAAKVTAKLEATVQGFGNYNSQFGVGVVVVMVAIILVLAAALILTLWLSHAREMKRIACGRDGLEAHRTNPARRLHCYRSATKAWCGGCTDSAAARDDADPMAGGTDAHV